MRRKKKHAPGASGNSTDVLDALSRISPSEIRQMQLHIEQLAWSLQYSIPPDNASLLNPWTPPSVDSVDVIIKNMFLRVKNSITGDELLS